MQRLEARADVGLLSATEVLCLLLHSITIRSLHCLWQFIPQSVNKWKYTQFSVSVVLKITLTLSFLPKKQGNVCDPYMHYLKQHKLRNQLYSFAIHLKGLFILKISNSNIRLQQISDCRVAEKADTCMRWKTLQNTWVWYTVVTESWCSHSSE